MEGFDGTISPQPVYITLQGPLAALGKYGPNPISINGGLARFSGQGLIIDIPGSPTVRHWIPISAIVEITQDQPS